MGNLIEFVRQSEFQDFYDTSKKQGKKRGRFFSSIDSNHLASVIHERTINRVGKETITASLTSVISEVDII